MSKLFSPVRTASLFLVLGISLIAVGCGREEIKVYRVSKQEPAMPRAAAAPDDSMASAPAAAPAKPQISWVLPAGWQETAPGQMSTANFNIAGANGTEAQVSITPLRGLSGKEVPIVNMWRQQVGLPELSAEEAEQQLKPVDVGGQPGKMFEVTGKSETGASKRIVTAMLNQDGSSWFYKIAGDEAVVEAQKPAFLAFLKSIKMTAAPAMDSLAAPAEAASAPSSSFNWKVPADWKTVAPGDMQLAKFGVPAVGAAKADVMVSVFPSSTGGTLANVNRWRRQIGLPPVDEAGLASCVAPLDDKNSDAVVADLTSEPRRLVGVIMPRDGRWFFYKLLGDAAAVAPQKEAFLAFARSQP